MVVGSRLEQVVRYVRGWRGSADGPDPIEVAPDLPDGDLRRLRRLIDDAVDGRGGEVAARRRARAVGTAFSTLDDRGRQRFFELLAHDYGYDDPTVDRAMDAVFRAVDPADRRRSERALREALETRRERLRRRCAGLDGGLPFLIALREDLLGRLRASPELTPVDDDLKLILAGWFDVALLRLERITWSSPAVLLERLIEYEAVHAIESWDDLKGRLGPGRRCYAFLHPAMADDPLVFVEVALTRGIADDLNDVLDHEAAPPDRVDTAIFYSISSCHRGLDGVSLGDLLIKSVVEQLTAELPELEQFATLSPLPGLRRWLTRALGDGEVSLSATNAERLSPGEPDAAVGLLQALVTGPLPGPDDPMLERAQPALLGLAARYLLDERRGDRALDPVANFHLANGASVDRLNWAANPTPAGWDGSLGMMVNYRYRLRQIERNHDRYVGEGTIAAADAVRKLVGV
ncbi:MAG: malonyl-CoA decarboxylase domain-containing protein [Acidimicrobiales bacterium]